tara:strand:+ start:555 stop:695 length:141 start_codon:yes stop_codon:yes gene_type:complete
MGALRSPLIEGEIMAKKDAKKVKKEVKKVAPKVVKPTRGVYTKRGK